MTKIQAHLIGKSITSNSAAAISLQKQRFFGEKSEDKIKYSIYEAFFLVEKNKLEISSGKKVISKKDLEKKLNKIERKFSTKYSVFKDLREKGNIVKTALKFGADFRVYKKGTKPGQTHAKWIVFADSETNKVSWHDFSAKNRIAHSTKKNLLLAIVDEEGDVLYYEISWIKP
jgi:tRNA-intron endonuclease, archaea type